MLLSFISRRDKFVKLFELLFILTAIEFMKSYPSNIQALLPIAALAGQIGDDTNFIYFAETG